jgi:anthranilate phosphoribosyltransferase
MSLTELTRQLLSGEHLTEQQAAAAALAILREEASPVQVAAFLTALQMRGETVNELVGFAEVLRNLAEPFQAPPGVVLDTCGTGGDHSGTFNISTAVAFVVAGAGVKVAKHGNRSVTSKCGSADVLVGLGMRIDSTTQLMERALREIGICFLFAPQYHKAMRAVASIRPQLGFRTIFNMLGPLINPARATHQLIGVFSARCAELYTSALVRLGTRRALVVHGSDGLDEISTTAPTYVAEVRDGHVNVSVVTPEDFGFTRVRMEALHGGTAEENAATIIEVLSGAEGPKTDIVLLNAGAALYVAEQADSIEEGIAAARESIRSGAALAKLHQLRELMNTEEGPSQ